MKRSDGSLQGIYITGITALFLAGFFLLVVFGARIYRNAISIREENNSCRAQLSALQTALRQADETDAVVLDTYDGGQLLRIADGDTGYGVLMYAEDGRLLQEYTALSAQPDPDAADEIAETESFSVQRKGNLLTVTMDAGTVTVYLRSAGGVAGE